MGRPVCDGGGEGLCGIAAGGRWLWWRIEEVGWLRMVVWRWMCGGGVGRWGVGGWRLGGCGMVGWEGGWERWVGEVDGAEVIWEEGNG